MATRIDERRRKLEIDPIAAAVPLKRMLRQSQHPNTADILEALSLLGYDDAYGAIDQPSVPLVAREPESLFELVREDLYGLGLEQLHVAALSAGFVLLAKRLVYQGTVNGIRKLEVRNVFRDALLTGAAYIVMFHNHPSGIIQPSPLDRRTMRDICRKGRLLGIDVLDHIITHNDRAFSMRRAKMLPKLSRKI